MIDLALILLIIGILAFYAYTESQHNKERNKWLNSIMSRNATELRDLELTDKVQPITPPTQPDFVDTRDLRDDEFNDFIKGEVSGN
jgi:hypothetical protein